MNLNYKHIVIFAVIHIKNKNKKMKQTILLFIVLIMSACNKKTPAPELDGATTKHTRSVTNMNGWTEYRISSSYENNYMHFCQLNALAYGSLACGPTSYMLAAHMIAAANGWTFMPSSAAKLNAIISTIGPLPISLDQIENYVNIYDGTKLASVPQYGITSRSDFKLFLEENLLFGSPIVVGVRVAPARVNNSMYLSENSVTNHDIDGTDQPGRNYYINTSGANHFVVLIGIKINNATGNGYAYYKDPLATSGATKICSYSRFLNSILYNGGSACCYDGLAIRKK